MKKYKGKTWIDKNGVEWSREKDGGLLINFLSEVMYEIVWWVEEKVFKYQLTTDAENLQGLTKEK